MLTDLRAIPALWLWLSLQLALAAPALAGPGGAEADADGEGDSADRIELTSGDVLLGRIVEENDQQITLEHPIFGRMQVQREQVATIVHREAAEAAVAEDATEELAEDAAEAPADGAAPPSPAADAGPPADADADAAEPEPRSLLTGVRDAFEDWDLELALGFSDRASNVRTFNFHTRFNARYADATDRWRINAGYHRATSNGDTTRNDIRVGLQKDWLLPDSAWFFFAQTDYQHDTIKSWDHRLATHGGIGYDLEELLGIDARLRGGFGVTKEFGGVEPKTRPESLMGSELNLQLTDVHSIAGSVQFMPTVDGSGHYRVTSDADWNIKLTDELTLRFGVQHEYDSAVPAGFKKHDRRLTGSLVFRF